ncbi:LLM class flavin-dependent oxidoreductase [Pararoseomonas indoligenes]|uniref:LLM class flavin-dependent oxidoreductase n=1 Tax=Roseomonas indoligenes TaxID=2820811 RepID=A0A940MZ74_9PROT|nr:LLM class flavin-dependent oxidoreductase [Pararoseomonas indoligenes]MBP0496069.1 LLM class flavin-dependent oxidoreductase [Pararoseomonas indoligenes]
MAGAAPPNAARRRNPLLGGNRMKLGIFGTNGKGAAQTLVPEAYRPSWKASVETAQLADALGFEAVLAYARWKGYIKGEPAHPSGVTLDPFTWCAGIAQATRHMAVIATSHAPTLHPVTAAKQCATIDIIADGRFALNVVGGWNKPELEMFGAAMAEHDARYDHLEEWLDIIQRLWREEAEFDHEGRFFRILRGSSMPKPLQQPGPPIVNAGGSDRGQRFACEHADICFLILRSEDTAEIAAQIAVYKDMARRDYGREVQVWTYAYCVQRGTRAEAEDYLEHFAVRQEDGPSLDAWSAGVGSQTKILQSAEAVRAFRKRFAAGAGGSGLVGTAGDIALRLEQLSDAGLDGVLLTWVDFADGLRRFEEAMPLLEGRGLRDRFRPAERVPAC